MIKILKNIFVSSLLFLFVVNLNAAGFALYEYSARGNAMGGAVLANRAEPASVAANPALLTKLSGTQAQTGATAVTVGGSTEISGRKKDLKTTTFYLPTLYITRQMRDDIYLGVGLFSRFGLGGKYKDYSDWLPAITERQSYRMNLDTYSLNPVMASRVTDDLSLAGGFEIMYAHLIEDKGFGRENGVRVEGDSITWGANFGLYYNPAWAEKWSAALTYRTKTRHLATGEVTATGAFASASGTATAALVLPDQIAFGLSFTPSDKLVLEADIMGIFWSSYKQLRIDYDDLRAPNNEYKNYNDVYRLSVGGEYILSENWALRAGYVYDKSPINHNFMDTMVPADDRHIFSIGLGYEHKDFGVDASYSYMAVSDLSGYTQHGRPIKYIGATSTMLGLSVRYKF